MIIIVLYIYYNYIILLFIIINRNYNCVKLTKTAFYKFQTYSCIDFLRKFRNQPFFGHKIPCIRTNVFKSIEKQKCPLPMLFYVI